MRSSWWTPCPMCFAAASRRQGLHPRASRPGHRRFFRKGNLIALRELALRRTAERVDAQMRRVHGRAGNSGHLGGSGAAAGLHWAQLDPGAAGASHAATAARLHADWSAVHVETGRDLRLTAGEREEVLRALELTEQLGGRAVTLSGQSVAEEIVAYARAHNITRIILGKAKRTRWASCFGAPCWMPLSGPVERSSCWRSPAMKRREASRARQSQPPGSRPGGTTSSGRHYRDTEAIGVVLRRAGMTIPPIDAAMLYLLAVVVAATRFRRGPALLASLLGVASFDFFFVHPYYTFSVADIRYVLTFVVMLG